MQCMAHYVQRFTNYNNETEKINTRLLDFVNEWYNDWQLYIFQKN